jgi:hypothetical protein
MKYMLTTVPNHCSPLQNSYLPSLCSGSSIFATAATDFVEFNVGQLSTVPEFQGHLVKDTAVTAIALSKIRRHHKTGDQAGRGNTGKFFVAQNCRCFCTLVSN